ncbi:MAG: DnaA/Hda family protein [Phycisphaerales bacterium]
MNHPISPIDALENEPNAAADLRLASPSDDGLAAIHDLFRGRIGSQRFERWMRGTELTLTEDRLVVQVSSAFGKRMFEDTWGTDLASAIATAIGRDVAVEVQVVTAPLKSSASADASEAADAAALHAPATAATPARVAIRPNPAARGPRKDGGLRDLATFVVGPSNRLAWTAASQAADIDSLAPAGLLFLHGECGVGKTHLLQGVCRQFTHAMRSAGQPARVRYCTGEQFTNEFIASVRDGRIETFRERVRRLDLLAIDDIHFLENKVRTQNELLHTLDAIDLVGSRVVLASDGHPTLIRRCGRGLVNRFLSGMVIEVERPDRETRRAIAQRLAVRHGLDFGPAAIEAVASHCVGSVREIEGAVTKVAAMHRLEAGDEAASREIGLCLVERVLKDAATRPMRPVRVTGLIDATCRRLQLVRSDLVGGSRRGHASLGRSIVSFLAKEMTPSSYPEIARGLGLASHASVHRAVQTVRDRLGRDDQVRDLDGSTIELRELIDQVRHDAGQAATRNAR